MTNQGKTLVITNYDVTNNGQYICVTSDGFQFAHHVFTVSLHTETTTTTTRSTTHAHKTTTHTGKMDETHSRNIYRSYFGNINILISIIGVLHTFNIQRSARIIMLMNVEEQFEICSKTYFVLLSLHFLSNKRSLSFVNR